MLILGPFGKTTVFAVTAAADSFTNPGPYTSFMVLANRAVHLSRDGDATVDEVLIPTDTPVEVSFLTGAALSFILADGETDGTLRITEVSK